MLHEISPELQPKVLGDIFPAILGAFIFLFCLVLHLLSLVFSLLPYFFHTHCFLSKVGLLSLDNFCVHFLSVLRTDCFESTNVFRLIIDMCSRYWNIFQETVFFLVVLYRPPKLVIIRIFVASIHELVMAFFIERIDLVIAISEKIFWFLWE